MNRIARELAQLPASGRALSALLMFSAILMGALYLVRLGADLNFDGEIYISAAYKFALGMNKEGLEVYPMPFYSYLISFMHKIIPDWVLAGRLISYIFMTLTIIPLYRLSTDLFNRQAAFWSCLAFALLPETLLHANSVLRDPGFVLFFMWAVYSAQTALTSKRTIDLFKAALLGFVSTLFRIEGLILFPIYLGILIVPAVAKRNQTNEFTKMAIIWGGFFLLLTAAVTIAMESRGTLINRYHDWVVYSQELTSTSILKDYRQIYEQFQQMHAASVNKGIGQHFVETAMKLIPLIYLLGTVQMLFSVILPVNMVPLLWGLKGARYSERHVLVLILGCCLFALATGFFIRQGFIIKRYLFMPAVMLCPWVGFGMDRILAFAQSRSFKKLIVGCVLLLFVAAPALEFDKYFKNKDDLKSQMGSWIARQEGLKNLKIVFNDQVVKFYTDMGIDRPGDRNTLAHLDADDLNFSKLARFALTNKVDAIVIASRADRIKDLPDFVGYKEVKEFKDERKFIKLYLAAERLNSLENQSN